MLRSILSAVGRAVAWAANKCLGVMFMPVHALLAHLFPAAYEPLPTIDEDESAAFDDGSLPYNFGFDPFASTDEMREKREIEVNRVLEWAADVACGEAEAPLPNVRPELLPWLASLSEGELDAFISAGKNAAYGHLYFSIAVPGVPAIFSRGRRSDAGGQDVTFSNAEFRPAAAF